MSSSRLHYNAIIMVSQMVLHYHREQPPNLSASVREKKKEKKAKVGGKGIKALKAPAPFVCWIQANEVDVRQLSAVSVSVARNRNANIHTCVFLGDIS